jgi:hypothetical protein
MTTYVLVHGGWHGGWCWKKVAPLLRAAGHEVATPTLTGLGERDSTETRRPLRSASSRTERAKRRADPPCCCRALCRSGAARAV